MLLDSDLAALYQVETKALTRAVRRNPGRFPADFMFQLAVEESASLRSQSGALKTGRGKHRKYAPYVFTEQGIAMLSSVLKSERAVHVNDSKPDGGARAQAPGNRIHGKDQRLVQGHAITERLNWAPSKKDCER